MEKNILELRNVTKQYDGKVVLKGISMNIKEGEFVTILGPSGCGKTTTLNLINGKERLDSGELLMNGKDISKLAMNRRPINTIFQSYALFPNFTVFGNVAYGPMVRGEKYKSYNKKVKQYLRLVGLEGYEDKSIEELSGGQKQRVAMARALINRPKVLLLDEPMAALDVQLRKRMQNELKKIQEEIGITFVLITHDQEEALTLSDRIIVMNNGVIQQVGTPESIYNEPENLWVARFIGESNIIQDGSFVRDYLVAFDDREFQCVDRGFGENEPRIDIVIRPEDIDIVPADEGFYNGTVISTNFKGVHWEIKIETEYRNYLVHTTDLVEINTKVGLRWNIEDIHVMWKEIDD